MYSDLYYIYEEESKKLNKDWALCPSLYEDTWYGNSIYLDNKKYNMMIGMWASNITTPYFILYNNMYVDHATKVARIRIDKTEYLDYINDSSLDTWYLNEEECITLTEILKSYPNYSYHRCVWENIIYTYNCGVRERHPEAPSIMPKKPNYIELVKYNPN